jgi:MFS family permease
MKKVVLGTIIFFLAALFLYYEMGVQVSPSVMTKAIMRDFAVSATGLSLLSSVYFYSYTIMQIPAGLLFDRLSKRLIIPTAVAVVAFGCFFFGATSSLGYAALGRFLMGFGSAFAFISVLVVAARWFSPHAFAFLAGLAQLLAALGAIGGELPLSYAVNHYGWRHVMQSLGWIGLVLAVLCAVIIRRNPDYQMLRGRERVSVFRSIRVVFSSGQNWLSGFFAFCLWGPMSIFASLWGVPYLMVRYDVPNTEAALMVACMWIGIGIVSPIIGWFSDKTGRRSPFMWALSLIGFVASFLLIFVPCPKWSAYVLLFLMGAACSSQILSFAIARDSNRPTMTATAIGFINMVLVASGAILQPISGAILSANWTGMMSGGAHHYGMHEFYYAFLLLPLLYLLGFFNSAFALKDSRKKI